MTIREKIAKALALLTFSERRARRRQPVALISIDVYVQRTGRRAVTIIAPWAI
jgi:hypothetical protein